MRVERRVENRCVGKGNGGLFTMPFIMGLEASEKMASAGLKKNMVNYLRRELHLSISKSANTLTNFNGTASLTPLVGALLSDSFAGKFWTISLSSIIFILGLTCITISASIPQLRPSPCHGKQECEPPTLKHMLVLYSSLVLIAFGWGGIRSSLAAFGADQLTDSDYDHKRVKSAKKSSFFSWFFFVSAASMLVAATLLVYIQDYIGWNWGFGIPVVILFIMTLIFITGRRRYLRLEPSGSPYLRLLQVGVAAFRKINLPMVSDSTLLFNDDQLDASTSTNGKLCHTKQFKFLDKAAIMTDQDYHQNNASQKPNLWRISTVHRVEELKSIVRMVPIWIAGIICFTASAQQDTFSVEQANTMDRHLTKSFKIPSGSMSVFTMLSMLITVALFSSANNISHLQRIGVGLVVSALTALVAGFVEIKRKQAPALSVLWLVPQYALHGVSEAFMSTGNLHFSYDQAPESMRSTATALFWVSMAAGNYGSSLLVGVVHRWSLWIPDDLNKGRLEWFYWVITALQVVNFGYYLICAKHYTLKPVQEERNLEDSSTVHSEGGDV